MKLINTIVFFFPEGVIVLCENMPSGTAIKPGDVVTSRSGKTIQVSCFVFIVTYFIMSKRTGQYQFVISLQFYFFFFIALVVSFY